MKIKMGILKSNEKGYQGWTNYETWATMLWINNEQPVQDHWHERAREITQEVKKHKEHVYMTVDEEIKFTLADELRDEINDNMPSVKGVYADLLQSAVDNIDYEEIAEAIIRDVKEG